MFEKEAEEYIKVNNLEWELECHRTSPIGEVKQAFQKGAELAYNKANKWHYVKDGDLPKDSGIKLCYTRTAKYVCASYDEEYDCWGFVFNNLEHCIPSSVIIAWKEIVLPEQFLNSEVEK